LKTLTVDNLDLECLEYKRLATTIIVTGVQEREAVEYLVGTAKTGAHVILQADEITGSYSVKRACCTAFILYPTIP